MHCASKTETLINGAALSMSIQVKKEVVDDYRSSFRRNTPDTSLIVENRAKRTRTTSDDCDGESSLIMHKAKEVQAKLNPQFPSFIKMMSKYHITNCLMSIPVQFHELHLPKNDQYVILMGEDGIEFFVQFLVQSKSPAFSGGWGSFVGKHKLVEGDALIFQLVNPLVFKVHFVRRNALPKGDGAIHQQNLSANANESNCGTFVDLQSFTIVVKGLDIASKLSEDIRRKYYELCLSRKLNLHEHLLGIIKPSFAAELITGTIEIVDAIQGSGVFTSEEEFVVWDKALKSFELLGMDVGFLRLGLNQLKEKKHVFETEIESEIANHIKNLKARYDLMFREVARAAW